MAERESENHSEQEEVVEEDFNPTEFNWRRACLRLSEMADELRIRFSAMEFSDFQVRCMLLHHEVLIKGAKRVLEEGDDEVEGESPSKMRAPCERDLNFDQDLFEIENSGRLTVSGGDVLSSEERAPEEAFGEPKN